MQLQAFAPDCIDQVYLLAASGMDDSELCRIFGVGMGKLKAWRKMYANFDEAISRGRLLVDAKVLEAHYRRAIGYDINKEVRTSTYDEDGMTTGVVVKREVVHVPGDVGAQKHWLQNRQREQWKERKEVEVNVTLTLGARLEAALARVGSQQKGQPSIAAPVDDEVLEADFEELHVELPKAVGAVSDPEPTE